MKITTAIVRRAFGWPVLFAQVGTSEQDARTKAWKTCRNTGLQGFRIDTVDGPWTADDRGAPRWN